MCRHEFGPKGYGLWWPGNTRLCILGSNLFLPYHGHGSRGIPFASLCGTRFVLIEGHFWIRGKHWQTTWHFGMHKTWLGCREYSGIPRWNIVDCQSSAQFILQTSATFCQDEKPTRWLSSAAKKNFPFVVYNNQCRSRDLLLRHAMSNCGKCTFSQLSIALAMKDFPVPRFDSLKSLWEYSKIPHCLQSQRNKDSTVVSWISWVLDLSVEDKKRFPKQVKRRMYSGKYRWEIWVEIPEIGTKLKETSAAKNQKQGGFSMFQCSFHPFPYIYSPCCFVVARLPKAQPKSRASEEVPLSPSRKPPRRLLCAWRSKYKRMPPWHGSEDVSGVQALRKQVPAACQRQKQNGL